MDNLLTANGGIRKNKSETLETKGIHMGGSLKMDESVKVFQSLIDAH